MTDSKNTGTPKPNNEAAIRFLKEFNPSGPWMVTAIAIDRKAINTETFNFSEEVKLEDWLIKYNGKRNIYFNVNPPLTLMKKKAERTDIKSVDYLHVDVDPDDDDGKDPTEHLKAERARILSILTDDRPKGVPEPTFLIFSGGGYQAFWKLEEPIPVNGDLGLAEDAKLYNQKIEQLYNADHCHNIDRIMRLPGTVNIPDAKKKKKGRTKELAKVIIHNPDNVYKINEFQQSALVQSGKETFSGGINQERLEISGNVEKITDINELDEWNVPERVKVAVVQGRHPYEPKEGDNSRSAWVFDVACNLVRAGVPDNVIFSIFTDSEWGISESILEMKNNAEKYAKRQIERAKEWAVDPNLVKLNDQFAIIGNMGGKCRVIEEVNDQGLDRTRLTKLSFPDFSNRFMHQKIKIGETSDGQPKFMALGKWWLSNPKRRQYDYIEFSPGGNSQGGYNLWRGFSVAAMPGDCQMFLEHVRENICRGEEELFDYVVKWMARAVQQPDSTGEVAIVMRGGRGTGKSFFAKEFGKLFGRHFMQVSNSGHLVGNFNAHLRDCIVLFADEAFFAGDRKHASVLKTLITEETIPIESKGVDVETAPNYVHLIMSSNEDHVVPAGGDERRFVVLDVGENKKQDSEYFADLADQLDNGGREALLYYLQSLDLSNFNVRYAPQTDALNDQKVLSMSDMEQWWFQKLSEGILLPDDDEWKESSVAEFLHDDYIDFAKKLNNFRRASPVVLGHFLKRMSPNLTKVRPWVNIDRMCSDGFIKPEKKRMQCYNLGSLEECRETWVKIYGKGDWLDIPKETG